MLSLSPRYDLFRIVLPKDFIPEEIDAKYRQILSKNAGVIVTPIDYLNESIKGVHFPGFTDLLIEQAQHGSNPIERRNQTEKSLGRINIEPTHNIVYESASNPLEKLERELKITFRMNQGLYNYFMLYEIIFHHACKHINRGCDDVICLEILDEKGLISARLVMKHAYINGIDGLDFSYDKTNRDTDSFDLTFKFNNIDFEFLP